MKPDLERTKEMTAITEHALALYTLQKRPRYHISISYRVEDDESIAKYSDWNIRYFQIITGEEYFMIRDTDDNRLLYVVNVSGDSVLTAAWELLSLMSRKF